METALKKFIIIGTSGHVDHGKSQLVKALTGTDPDRLKVEKEREMTTDLGFAFLKLPSGHTLPVIDVPGHERFVKTMVAGATGIDLVLFVIAADEGIEQQTREHLDILNLLRIPRGIIVLTKIDLVKDDWAALVEDETRKLVKGTVLEKAPIVRVSSKTGQGIAELKELIGRMAGEITAKESAGVFRLPIDRAFVMQGFGTVVTGTVIAGKLDVNAETEILPQGKILRVRGIQMHGGAVTSVWAGQRAAINLVGIEKQEIERGNVLVSPGSFKPTGRIDTRLQLLPNLRGTFKNNATVFLNHGTSEVVAQAAIIGKEELAPGEAALVQFKPDRPIVAAAGDRFIIRSYSPSFTLGGGTIVSANARRYKRKKAGETESELSFLETADIREKIVYLCRKNRYVAQTPESLAGELHAQVSEITPLIKELAGAGKLVAITANERTLLLSADEYGKLKEAVCAALKDFHASQGFLSGIPSDKLRGLLPAVDIEVFRRLLEDLEKEKKIKLLDGKVSLAGHTQSLSPEQQALRKSIEDLFLKTPFTPPALDRLHEQVAAKSEAISAVVRALLDAGTLVKAESTVAFHKEALSKAKEALTGYLSDHPSITAAQFRDLLQTNRKFAIVLVEYFDKVGVTRRSGDAHVLRR